MTDQLAINASPEEIRSLSIGSPGHALMHPNIDPELFAELAGANPFEALQNPALQLWLLEEPMFWEKIEVKYAEDWLIEFPRKLSVSDQGLFMVDCLRDMLSLPAQGSPVDLQHRTLFDAVSTYADSSEPRLRKYYIPDSLLDEFRNTSFLINGAGGELTRGFFECCDMIVTFVQLHGKTSSTTDWIIDCISDRIAQEIVKGGGDFFDEKSRQQIRQWRLFMPKYASRMFK